MLLGAFRASRLEQNKKLQTGLAVWIHGATDEGLTEQAVRRRTDGFVGDDVIVWCTGDDAGPTVRIPRWVRFELCLAWRTKGHGPWTMDLSLEISTHVMTILQDVPRQDPLTSVRTVLSPKKIIRNWREWLNLGTKRQ